MHELPQMALTSSLFGCAMHLFKLVHTCVLLVSMPVLTICAFKQFHKYRNHNYVLLVFNLLFLCMKQVYKYNIS